MKHLLALFINVEQTSSIFCNLPLQKHMEAKSCSCLPALRPRKYGGFRTKVGGQGVHPQKKKIEGHCILHSGEFERMIMTKQVHHNNISYYSFFLFQLNTKKTKLFAPLKRTHMSNCFYSTYINHITCCGCCQAGNNSSALHSTRSRL